MLYSFVDLDDKRRAFSKKNLGVPEALEKINFLVRMALDGRGNRITIAILSKGIVLQRLTEQHTLIPEDGFLGEMDFGNFIFSLVAYVIAYPRAFSLNTVARDFIEKNKRHS